MTNEEYEVELRKLYRAASGAGDLSLALDILERCRALGIGLEIEGHDGAKEAPQ